MSPRDPRQAGRGDPRGDTPRLDARLDELRGRITRLVWVHGLSTALGAAALWMLLTFAIDWSLHVPHLVRWFHLGMLLAIPAVLLARELVRPLAARPDRVGLAVLYERAHPELGQLAVSAVELPLPGQASAEAEAVAAIRARAESVAERLDPERALDRRGPRRRLLAGLAALALLGTSFALQPEAARIYLERLFGGDTPWPQRTHLELEVPIAGIGGSPNPPLASGRIQVRVARGSDVPVIVRALGEAPEEVTLHLSTGQRLVLASAGGDTFRTFLRALTGDVRVWATGGDDEDQDPELLIEVLDPPDVGAIAIEVEPPAYAGLAPRVVFEPELEVLAGSRLVVHVQPDPAEARGLARLLPEDQTRPLLELPFPARESGAQPQPGLGFELEARKSLRYRIELSDANGLSNPDPGLYSISVLADRPPEVEVLSPSRGDLDTVVTGWISLRVRAEDDFGISGLSWSAAPAGGEGQEAPEHELAARALSDEEAFEPGREPGAERPAQPRPAARNRARVFARARLSVADLAGSESAAEGAQFQLLVRARDNRDPAPQEGRGAAVRVRVVSVDEFLRRAQDRLNRAQTSTTQLVELSREKLREGEELLATLGSDAPELKDGARAVAALTTGLKRVQGDARSLARELVSLVEAVLYARIDERSQSTLEFIDARLAESTARGFDPAPWRDLAGSRRRGELPAGTFAAKLVEITGVALEVSEEHSARAAEAALRAQEAPALESMHSDLVRACAEEKLALEQLERLRELLAEWDNFQSVLNLTRDILNGQKTLNERTRQRAKDR